MRKFLAMTILAALLLAGCGAEPAQTPAQAYLADHTETEIYEHFVQAPYFFQDFDDPAEITTRNLYGFAMLHERDSWYNEADRLFYIPLADIYEILDEYLPDYNFDLDGLQEDFDEANQQIVTTATGMGSGGANYEGVVQAEVIDDENIKVTLLGSFEDYDYAAPVYWEVYITARIIDGEAKFTSLTTSDIIDDYDLSVVE